MVRQDWRGEFQGQVYLVPDSKLYDAPIVVSAFTTGRQCGR